MTAYQEETGVKERWKNESKNKCVQQPGRSSCRLCRRRASPPGQPWRWCSTCSWWRHTGEKIRTEWYCSKCLNGTWTGARKIPNRIKGRLHGTFSTHTFIIFVFSRKLRTWWQYFFNYGPFLASSYFIFAFSRKSIGWKLFINVTDGIWTADLWCRKWSLYQLSHHHYLVVCTWTQHSLTICLRDPRFEPRPSALKGTSWTREQVLRHDFRRTLSPWRGTSGKWSSPPTRRSTCSRVSPPTLKKVTKNIILIVVKT